jgi:hypothetical protein
VLAKTGDTIDRIKLYEISIHPARLARTPS